MNETQHNRCEPHERLRERIARAIHEGLGESWAYSNYSGNEWVACRTMLDSAADAVLSVISPVATPAAVEALRAVMDQFISFTRNAEAAEKTLRARVEALEAALRLLVTAHETGRYEPQRIAYEIARAALEGKP